MKKVLFCLLAGAAPGASFPDKTEVYGVGAFLAAGAELYTFLGGE